MHKLTPVMLAAAVLPCAALAQHREPGQWAVTTQMRFTQGGPQIPAELRAKMEARGVALPGTGTPHTFKTCLTAADAAKEDHPDFNQNKDCKLSSAAWSGTHFHADINCNRNGSVMHGVVDGEVGDGGKRVTASARMAGQNPALGGAFVMESHTSGQWIGPVCSKDDP